ncbi:MAG: prephenate dehydrogenase [Armatimonadota bacterium]
MFHRAVIVGPGLMGGSLGLVLRRRRLASKVVGVARRPETLQTAVEVGAIDEGMHDIGEAACDADLLVIATPVSAIVPVLLSALPHLSADCLVTDMGSVKSAVVRQADEALPDWVRFVGGHPMCGSEEAGPAAAKHDLYEGAVWALTPTDRTLSDDIERLCDLIRAVGALPLILSPEEHDAAVAAASHLPHAVACVLALTVWRSAQENRAVQKLCASGFRDTTRVASGSPEMWSDILMANAESVLAQLDVFSRILDELSAAIRSGDASRLTDILREAARARADCLNV